MKFKKIILLMIFALPLAHAEAKAVNCFLKVNSKNLILSNISLDSGIVQNTNGLYHTQYYLNSGKVTQIVVTFGPDRFLGMTTTTDVGVEELNYWAKNGDDVIVSGCKVTP